jgi:hypothetical protein
MQCPISTPAAAAAIFIFKSNFSIPRIFFPFFLEIQNGNHPSMRDSPCFDYHPTNEHEGVTPTVTESICNGVDYCKQALVSFV